MLGCKLEWVGGGKDLTNLCYTKMAQDGTCLARCSFKLEFILGFNFTM